jgi:REP-associated tyrosine transposase
MPSQPRYAIIGDRSTFHVTWQCHNKDWLLESDWAKRLYYNLLLQFKERYRIQIYSYCFMSSHPHLTGFCESKKLLSDFFRIVNSLFARKFNKRVKRRGQVVMDRFKSPVIQTEVDHLKVMFYNDLNPKRAHMVKHPKEYGWSSFHYYAYGREDRLITAAPSYLSLGSKPMERRRNYLKLIEEILKNDWKEKRPYSSIPFIGDPNWVTHRILELRQIRKHRKERWRELFNLKFGSKDPPS